MMDRIQEVVAIGFLVCFSQAIGMTKTPSYDAVVITIEGVQREINRSRANLFKVLSEGLYGAIELMPEKVSSAAWIFLESHIDALYAIDNNYNASNELRKEVLASCRRLPLDRLIEVINAVDFLSNETMLELAVLATQGRTDMSFERLMSLPYYLRNEIIIGTLIEVVGPLDLTTDAVFRGHEGRVYSVCLTVDGKYIVSGSSDGTIRMWDISLLEVLYVFDDAQAEALWKCLQNVPVSASAGDKRRCLKQLEAILRKKDTDHE